MKYDVVVIGGGPAGLAAAKAAKESGIDKVLIIERDKELGGILQQCIHNGFGLHRFKEELTGPEYAERYVNEVVNLGIETKLESMVIEVSRDKKISLMNPIDGYIEIEAEAVVLAMGCRERTRGAISIPGDRPSGIFTAGMAQRYINMEGYMVGKRVLILGSGDIGLIMARRMTLEGAKVEAVVEIQPFSGGLNRNIVQCLEDYDIPLYLSHTVTNIKGKKRLEQVTVSKVDENKRVIPGTERHYDVDTLLLSVGLIPENEISRQMGVKLDLRTNGPVVCENMETSIPGVFACGNVVHVHDLVDFVSAEGERAGKFAANYVREHSESGFTSERAIKISNGFGITYTVPQVVNINEKLGNSEIFMRVNNIYRDKRISVKSGGVELISYPKRHLAPGEMEKIVIPAKFLGSIKDDITIELVDNR